MKNQKTYFGKNRSGQFVYCKFLFTRITVSADGRTGPGPSSEEEGLYSLHM